MQDSKVAAFFDLDYTITNVDTFRIFLKKYYLSSPFKIHYVIFIFIFGVLRKFHLISLRTFKEKSLIGLKKMSRNEIYNLGEKFFILYLIKGIRRKAIKQIEKHKKNGDLVYIISGSPDIYLKSFNDYLNCDDYFCTNLEFEKNYFTGRISGNDCVGEEKLNRLNRISILEKLNVNKVFFYTDHDIDLPLLNRVGNPVAISPTKLLMEIAIKQNWSVKYW
ncbi:HAD family hydrolase [Candidatus Venteria ishoeyi]|uniref:Haloacid dehalogenase-like hydrolase n=1 Tax=Candidatus Venteria ishoeyi TaxID=1899563 RepID=A0A1H6FEQ5_9GAMM|nr:HAD-IB family hydrolase [Candidatus Venteria ishoeyi]SEH08558.1 haloacid dehalogenase-like hydrolase [Candidatus Venteria ishoeyi]